ncbi:MAG: aminodeoxychorismate synthase component I, partial [Endomicrobiia bacterium]
MLDYEISKLIRYIYHRYEKFVVFETLKVDNENFLSYFFVSPKKELVLYNFENIKKFFSVLEKYLSLGYYLAGFFSYELGYFLDYKNNKEFCKKKFNFPLAFFYIFDSPLVFDHKNYKFLGNTKILEDFLKYKNEIKDKKFFITNLNLNVSKDAYINAIKKIKEYILCGETYQVNYTIKTKFNFSGSLLKFYNFLKQNQKVSYTAFIKTQKFSILSFSPELFFRKIDDLIIMKPMKGTINRGRNIFEDKLQIKKLQNSIKNRAENIMIVDLLRNDLGKISKYAKVETKKLFEVEKYETLFQMTSTIQAKIDKNISLYKLFKSIFPSGSVTGAPKIRTMQIIKELEKEDRKVYTGSIGFFTPKKNAVFNVAIRTALIYKNGKSEMGIGSGIVSDSQPEKEFEECKLKSTFLLKKIPKFRLIETMLYSPKFDKEIKNFDDLKLNITNS